MYNKIIQSNRPLSRTFTNSKKALTLITKNPVVIIELAAKNPLMLFWVCNRNPPIIVEPTALITNNNSIKFLIIKGKTIIKCCTILIKVKK